MYLAVGLRLCTRCCARNLGLFVGIVSLVVLRFPQKVFSTRCAKKGRLRLEIRTGRQRPLFPSFQAGVGRRQKFDKHPARGMWLVVDFPPPLLSRGCDIFSGREKWTLVYNTYSRIFFRVPPIAVSSISVESQETAYK